MLLRGISIGARFLLSFLFVKYISLEFQGEYSLLLTSITVAMLFTGFDFYVYSNRFLIQNKEKANLAIYNQLFLHLITYVIFLIIFLSLREFNIYSSFLTFSIFSLLIFEHLGMEFFRLFIALKRPLLANIVLFIRTGTWPLYLIYLMLYVKAAISLELIVNSWLIASIASVVISGVFILKNLLKTNLIIDRNWILKGIGVAGLFFSSTLAQKGIEFSDRYIINSILGSKDLGIYSFYFQLGNVANVAIFTMFISFMYPDILSFIDQGNRLEAKKAIKKLRHYIFLFIVVYAIIIFSFLPFILDLSGKNELYDYKILLLLFLIGNMFFNLSFTSHYAMMAIHKDKALMFITLAVAVVNMGANIIAVMYFGIIGAVIVFCLSAFLLFFIKGSFEKYYFRKHDW